MSDGTDSRQLDGGDLLQILDVYFVTGDLEEAIAEVGTAETSVGQIYEQIRNSERARRYFNRLALADRGLESADEEVAGDRLDRPGPFEREFGDAAFEQRLDSMLAAESASSADGGSPQSASQGSVASLFGADRDAMATLATAALATLVAGAILYQFDLQQRDPSDHFNPRSATAPARGTGFARPDLELFCARRTGEDVDFRGGAATAPGDLDCPVDGELKLAYRNREPRLKFAAFFGVDSSGDILWYGPSPAAPAAVSVESSREIVPVGQTIRLEVNHTTGPLRVHAIFAPEPIDHATLQRRLRHKSDRELWKSRRLRFERWPSATTSEIFRVTRGDRSDEESR